MTRIYAIVANQVIETGTVSFKFMFDSNAPYDDFADIGDFFGLLTLKPRPEDFINPFVIGRQEAQAENNKDINRWNLFVFECGVGQVIGGGVDWDEKMEGLTKLIGEASDFVLLTHLEALDGLKIACTKLGIDLTVFLFEGNLSTS